MSSDPTTDAPGVASHDLLACFCGGSAKLTSRECGFRSATYYAVHSVRCTECSMHLSGEYLTPTQAATTWNNLMHDSRTYRNRRANVSVEQPPGKRHSDTPPTI